MTDPFPTRSSFSDSSCSDSSFSDSGLSDSSFSIDCAACVRRDTDTCDDCVVSFIVSREPDEAVVIDVASFAALRRLSDAGMVPELRHRASGE